ncbi:MAG: YdbL family protein, partial [Steroidobacteraceae bacterium]
AVGRALELLVPAAHADEPANLDIETPEIRAITASMHQRFAQLESYFQSGVVGLTADGRVEVRDTGSVALAERALVKRLVAEDNKDRDTLYAEIAKANGHPDWAADIRTTFARRWVERGAKPGWYYQDASGAWKQK